MSNGLARSSVRFRPASFAGTFIALLFGAAVIMACGTMLQTGITATAPPVRYANAPVVVAAKPDIEIIRRSDKKEKTYDRPVSDRARLDAALAQRIAAQPGVAAARADSAFPIQPGPATPGLTGRGYAALGIAGGADTLVEGHAPGDGEVVLDAATAREAHLAPGASLSLVAPGGSGTYRISGLAAPQSAGPTAWFADDTAGRLSGHPGRADAIAVQPREGVSAGDLARRLRDTAATSGASPTGIRVVTGDARGSVEQPSLGYSRTMLTAIGGSFGGTATMTVVFVVVSTIALATGQRAREFALLRAVGATPRQIRRTIATEAMLVAPLAGVLGLIPGVALARWWFDGLSSRGAVPKGVELDVGPLPAFIAVATCLLAALAAGYLAARRPSNLRPGQALGEASVPPARAGVVRTLLGVVAIIGGVVLSVVASTLDGENAANTALGVVMCLLVAIALLGPWVARAAAGVLGLPLRAGVGGASGSLAADNAGANARRLTSVLTPIAMVTAFCGTMLFIQSTVQHATGEQVRAGIRADHVLGSTGPGLPAGIAEQAARTPGVDAAVGLLRTGAVYRSDGKLRSAAALGVSGDPATLPRVLDLGVRTGSLADLARGTDTVAVDTALADKLGLKAGDRASFWLGDGTQAQLTVVATYERGLGFGQLILPRAAVAAHAGVAYDSQVLVADTPGADRTEVAARLAKLPADGPAAAGATAAGATVSGATVSGLTVADRAGYVAQTDRKREAGDWVNSVMAGVLGGFAAITAANTLVMTVLDRRREVALLRLAGATRRQVRGMMRWEALLVAAAGLLLGSVIAWITLVPIARGLARTAPYVPPGTALPLAAAAVALCLTATALPARALLRTRPLGANG
ncbi:ABC transporter permease [Kitasatospora brasiliensis]|uniref:ABC transporter permease n=1 Tax=Kitasatospora brasiliensis TaxID=3058040 RepID=UPI002930476C|nr:FtsX-like permease family protein [Kitasatospora sp. K002]